MRFLVLILAAMALTACGGKHHSAPNPHPVDHAFDRLVGSWKATCSVRNGDYAGIPVGTVAFFSIDNTGLLTGWDTLGQSLSIYLRTNGPTGFVATRQLPSGKTEQIFVWLTAPPIGTMSDGPGSSASWALVALTATG